MGKLIELIALRLGNALVLVTLFLAGCALPQSAESQTPSSDRYVWRNVAIGGGGFVTGIIFHPAAKDLMYARTDVGGAYRWDAAAKRWVPITDWIGVENVNFTGIESLALDPSDPNRVYLAAGTYSSGPAAILRSSDQGRTFQRTPLPVAMGGNETGRFNGERLAVDPNRGEILFFGSRRDGLWKSADRGAAWQKVSGFPDVGPRAEPRTNDRPRGGGFGAQQFAGIVCVLFDPASGKPGSPTPAIYAAVSVTGTNLFRSSDAGVTWQPVPDQPPGLRPNHVVRAPDGTLYLSYGREPGPNTMTDGAVWKFDPKSGAWTDLTPEKPATAPEPFGYGAVAVDARHPATLMVATFCHWHPHDEIFRSTDGGKTWKQIWDDETEWDHSNAPYTATRTPHWIGDLEINPSDSEQVLFTTGYGIWACVNATKADAGRPTRWVFLDEGLEETVPLALISPPAGAHLLSGLGDIDGFRHGDLNDSTAQGIFTGPRFSNTEDLAFAAKKPSTIVRTGTGSAPVHAAISEDGGFTWQLLNNELPGGGAGSIAISADGRIIVWTPRRGSPHFTLDRGSHWTPCAGLAAGVRVVADPIDATRFYAYDARAGRVLVSTNGAAVFAVTGAEFARLEGENSRGGGVLSATPGIAGDLWLAFRGDGLLHSTNGGISFTKIAGVQDARAFGFGRAAPGKTFPALYLAGAIGGTPALYRSDDAGGSWVTISDDEHRFGWISHVTGDPRIYGRVYFGTGGRGIIYGDRAVDAKASARDLHSMNRAKRRNASVVFVSSQLGTIADLPSD